MHCKHPLEVFLQTGKHRLALDKFSELDYQLLCPEGGFHVLHVADEEGPREVGRHAEHLTK